MFKTFIAYLFLLILGQGILLAGTTGKIAGTVVDKDSNDPLIGVNIEILGIGIGSATDADGYFFINNVPPGSYALQATYIGYQTLRIENVSVTVDHTTEIKITMQQTTVEVEEAVTVVADRPLIQKDETSKRTVIAGDLITDKLPVSSLTEVLSLQAGVVKDASGDLHIRGGRTGEIGYLIDGTYVRNPFDNSIGGNVAVDAIQEMEVISGAFNAEYGNALSGIVNVVTKEGTPELKFRFQYESAMLNSSPYHQRDWLLTTDEVKQLSPEQQLLYLDEVRDSTGVSAYRQYQLFDHRFTSGRTGIDLLGRFNGSLSGPLPLNGSFFIAGTFRNEESPLPFGYDLDRVISGKLSFNLAPTLKLQFNGDVSRREFQDYNHQYKYWQTFEEADPQVSSFPISEDRKNRFTARLTHTLSKSTFYNLSVARVYNYEENIVPNRTVITDPNNGSLVSSDYLTRGFVQGLDGSFRTGDVRYWRKTESTTIDIDADMVSQINRHNQVKGGLEFRQHDLFRHRVGMPPRERLEFFNREPVELAAYLQDKIELSFLIVNVGLRYDYFDAKDVYFSDPGNIIETVTNASGESEIRTVGAEAVPTKSKFSPRIGLAFPVSATTAFHFSYGQFFQIPRYYDLYRNNEIEDILTNDPLIGNPGLEPEETTAFEVGVKQQLGNDYAFDVTAYYKDIDNLISSFYFFSGRDYTVFINADFGRVQGLDLTFSKRYANFFSGALNYSFMIAEGNESDPIEGFTQYREDDAHLRPNRTFPLDFDQRHSFNVNVDLSFPRGFGPSVFGFKLLENLSGNFLLRAASGLPYTPTSRDPDATVVPERNSGRKPWTNQFDMRLNKRLYFGKVGFDVYLKAENLFDNINTLRVWTRTGKAWDQGPTSNFSKDRQANPENVDIRRQIRLGMIFRF